MTGGHLSDCSMRRVGSAVSASHPFLADIAAWSRIDPDVRLIQRTVLATRGLRSLAELDEPTLRELHESISLLLEESPTITTPGDPRRMV